MTEYDPHLAWSIVRNRGLMEVGFRPDVQAAARMFAAYHLPCPAETLTESTRYCTCGPEECVVAVKAPRRVDRWTAYVVLLCEALRARGAEPPAEMLACASLALSVGAVEVVLP